MTCSLATCYGPVFSYESAQDQTNDYIRSALGNLKLIQWVGYRIGVWVSTHHSEDRSQPVGCPLPHRDAPTACLDYAGARAQPTVLAQEKALLSCPRHPAICHSIHLLSLRNAHPRQLKWYTGLGTG